MKIAHSCLIVSCALAGLFSPPEARSQPLVPPVGSATMFIKYRADIKTRAAFIKYFENTEIQQFEKWKGEGVMDGYALYYNEHLDRETWDVLAVVDFSGPAQIQAWKNIERRSPGGLAAEGLSLGWPIATDLADRTWSGARPPSNRKEAYYYIIQYDYFEPEAYRAYCDVFLERQVKLWMQKGMLTKYDIWLNQSPRLQPCEEPGLACATASAPWDSLMIWEYTDLNAFAMRDLTKWQTRTKDLKDDDAFTAVSMVPRKYRIEYNIVLGRAIVAREK
jgi:hypothetical protein